MTEGWTEFSLDGIHLFAAVNYRGNVVITTNPNDDRYDRKELCVDLEYQKVVVV